VYSIFRGNIGAVDRYLEAEGRLVLLESVEDVRTKLLVKRRSRPAFTEVESRGSLKAIVDHIVAILEAGASESLNRSRGPAELHESRVDHRGGSET